MLIFLDMDGVLCDFVSAAYRVHGQTFDPATYPKGEFDIAKHLGLPVRKFWRAINEAGESFWHDLVPYDGTQDLIDGLSDLGEVVIATSPSSSPHSYSGKRRWLQKHGFGRLKSMFGSEKHLMASFGRVLVDDADHNIDKWMLAGGHGVQLAQPWNRKHGEATSVEAVLAEVSGYIKSIAG